MPRAPTPPAALWPRSSQIVSAWVNAGLSFAAFCVTPSAFDSWTAARSAANAGLMVFIAALSDTSSALGGGSGFLAISTDVELITDVATRTGWPWYFAATSGARSSL